MSDMLDIVQKSGIMTIVHESYIDRDDWKPYMDSFTNMIMQECLSRVNDLRGFSGVDDNMKIVDTADWNYALDSAIAQLKDLFKET